MSFKIIIRKLKAIPRLTIDFIFAVNQVRRKGGIVRAEITIVNSPELLKDKKILITGGSQGIGFAIARKFIECGAVVVVSGRNEDSLRKASKNINSSSFHWLVWDVANITSIEGNLSAVEALVNGPIDILVNNAGILINEPFLKVTEYNWDKTSAVNSKGLFFLTQAVCKRWVDNGKSARKVINISSTSGFLPGAYPYRMSKWDVVGMTKGLALKLANQGITVNGIAPGRTAGRMLGIDERNICDTGIPLGRAAMPEELAEVAAFLAGDASNYITGQTIICDGGMTL